MSAVSPWVLRRSVQLPPVSQWPWFKGKSAIAECFVGRRLHIALGNLLLRLFGTGVRAPKLPSETRDSAYGYRPPLNCSTPLVWGVGSAAT